MSHLREISLAYSHFDIQLIPPKSVWKQTVTSVKITAELIAVSTLFPLFVTACATELLQIWIRNRRAWDAAVIIAWGMYDALEDQALFDQTLQ
jgi:hypothetical protein